MKDKEGRQIVVVGAFNMVEKRVKELNAKLTEAEREKKNVEVALEGAERQVETQRSASNSTWPRISLLLLGSKSKC